VTYIHGTSPREQRRLIEQAGRLEVKPATTGLDPADHRHHLKVEAGIKGEHKL
jgi:hypothetical protein